MKKIKLFNSIKNSRFNRFIKDNKIIPKVSCILLAVILWTYVNGKKIGEKNYRLLINVQYLSSDYVISEMQKRYINVIAQGRRDDINDIYKQNIKVNVNLNNPVLDKLATYPLVIDKQELPEDIILKSDIKRIKIKVERKISKKVPVNLHLSGTLDKRYLMGDEYVYPSVVNISGPESSIKNISYIRTNNIFLNRVRRSINRRIRFNLDVDSKIVTNVKSVRVKIPIYKVKSLTAITKEVIVKSPLEGFNYKLSTEKVKLYFMVNKNSSFNADNYIAYTDFSIFESKVPEWNRLDKVDTQLTNIDIEFLKNDSGIQIIKKIPENVKINFFKE